MSAATIRGFNRTILLAGAPFLGLLLWLIFSADPIEVSMSERAFPSYTGTNMSPVTASEPINNSLDQAMSTADLTAASIQHQMKLYTHMNTAIKAISNIASAQAPRPLVIYDTRITNKLGKPSATIDSSKMRAQLFYLGTTSFKSYAVKIELRHSDAMQLLLGKDTNGGSETTLAAVQRVKAAIGINAGGFADSQSGRYPLSTTIVDSNYVNGFEASFKDLFFVGMNMNNQLIGGKFSSKEQLDRLNPKFGASFVPILLVNGNKTTIPSKWKTSPKRAPRTVIANYKDDQLLFIVADGYSEAGSSGATLEEMQDMLVRYGAIDGYNLDGGGSSTLIFNGKLINKPSDGVLRKLPTNFVFFK
ncbi:MAG: phosphodiester glycosidase family protein [Candidatus Cohnella colombiensis]|uniref:Phosphodiester glycosidase family protein n=1 Tax=Candidatus Cohnella colombiensis TaxID=3121368 RepID=A0AA95EY75_9BACL|nr:MAG: phosphodiester glycosidase family protein [Cohnella sp.]